MKRDYTILVPTMLPTHFKLIVNILNARGYHAVLLENSGRRVRELGLRYVHNDACYPAILVIGQFLDALENGGFDPHKTALMLSQTGGGCRASNYISLLRKALERAGYGYMPVISFNLAGMEKNPGFKLTPALTLKMFRAVMFGDVLADLRNQCLPYEAQPGDTEALSALWTKKLTDGSYHKNLLRTCSDMIADFAKITRTGLGKPRVGVVGEIFVKFSPLGNNDLENLLISEGAEVVVPGLLDFCLYCVYNGILDYELYGINWLKAVISKLVYRYLINKQAGIIRLFKRSGVFSEPAAFDRTRRLVEGYLGSGVKMGEGWLLTAEMLELIESGVTNVVCTQPFGCLPNHIVGKGMMRLIKERNAQANIVAIDYDSGASRINQENRIKLMLANAAPRRTAAQ